VRRAAHVERLRGEVRAARDGEAAHAQPRTQR
jgi:hypothetical protein